MYEVLSYESWRIVRRLARRAEHDLVMRDQTPDAQRVHPNPTRHRSHLAPLPPRRTWSGRPPSHSMRRRCVAPVIIAVPDGASTCRHGEARSPRRCRRTAPRAPRSRIINTAPMSEVGTMTALAPASAKRLRNASKLVRRESGGSDHSVHRMIGAPLEVLPSGVEDREVDRHLGVGVERALLRPRTLDARSWIPTWSRSMPA